MSEDAQDLVQNLLNPDPAHRMGIKDMLSHVFFKEFHPKPQPIEEEVKPIEHLKDKV